MRVLVAFGIVFGAVDVASGGDRQSAPSGGVRVFISTLPPLSGTSAVLVLADEDNPGHRREVTVTGTLVAWFGALPPATYRVSVAVPGGAPTEMLARVEATEIVTVAVTIGPAGQGTSRATIADRRREGEGAFFTDRLLSDLPAAADLWALIETSAPLVVVDRMDTGGVGLGRSALMGSRGEGWATTAVSFGGIHVKDPSPTGRLLFAPDVNAVEAVAVHSGLAPVEVETPGVSVRLAPRRPGVRLHGGFQTALTTRDMVTNNAPSPAPSIAQVDSWRNAGVFGGGPVTTRTGLFVSASGTSARLQERGRLDRVPADAATFFAHLVSQRGDRDQVRLLIGTQQTQHPFDGRAQFLDRSATERGRYAQGQLTWESHGASGARRAVSAGVQRAESSPRDLGAGVGGTVDRVLDGVVPSPAATLRRTQWNIGLSVDRPVARLAGMFQSLRLGTTLRRVRESSSLVALPTVAETVNRLPARVWQPVAPDAASSRGLTEFGVYVGDRIALGPKATLDLGLRADLAYGSARGAERGLTWASASPRLSFHWNPSVVGVFGGYGRYVPASALSLLSFGDPGEPRSDVRRWTDPNGNGQYDAGEAGALVSSAGRHRSIASIDAALRAPTSDEWTIGGELRHSAHATLRGAIVIRRQNHLVGTVNTGVPLSAYRVFSIFDVNSDEGSPHDDQMLQIYDRLPSSFGQDRFLLTNPDEARATYEGVELTWEIMSTRWQMLFGATTYRTRGSGGDLGAGPLENDQLVVGQRYRDPNAASTLPGRLFFDRAYVAKWSTSYRAPGDIRLAGVVRYQDGQPFTRLVVIPDLAGGPEIVEAHAPGLTRFTYTATIDARVEKGFTIHGRRAAVRLDVFNLTNHRNEVEEDVVTGPLFRRSTAVQPPRTLRFGLRFDF